jgi:hypothetical protein
MKRRTNHKAYKRAGTRRRRGGGVGAPLVTGRPEPLYAIYPGSTVKRKNNGSINLSYPLGDDGLTLHINHFRAESAANIKRLGIFFTLYCWKDKTNPDEMVFSRLEQMRRLEGHFIYITNASNEIVFAQLALIKDSRDGKGNGEVFIELMGTCTAPKHRGKGLFRMSLPLIANHYKRMSPLGKRGKQSGEIEGIILTADYKNRDGVTAQGRHIVFSKSGMQLADYVNGVIPYYVKTDDEKIYQVVPQYLSNIKPDSPLEVVVEEADGTRKKIPVATVTGCYKDAEATEREECPFILPFVYDH